MGTITYTGLVKLTTERIRDDKPAGARPDYDFKDAFKEAFSNRPLIGMASTYDGMWYGS
jgi:glycoside/pentoside/hexuronide:cation symporter, GPH family